MNEMLGRVMAVTGSQMTVGLEVDNVDSDAARIGAMVKGKDPFKGMPAIPSMQRVRASLGGDPIRRVAQGSFI